MHAVRVKADKNRTSAPANPERRRESGWTTLDKIRLPNAMVELEKYVRSPVARTFVNLRHDYVFAAKYVKRKGFFAIRERCCIPVTRLAVRQNLLKIPCLHDGVARGKSKANSAVSSGRKPFMQ